MEGEALRKMCIVRAAIRAKSCVGKNNTWESSGVAKLPDPFSISIGLMV